MRSKSSAPSDKPRFTTLSFLSDFGYKDEFVGVTKSVIYEMAPFARIVDITHGIEPYNIRAGALALARAGAYMCPGLVLAVVDPGVGSGRRAIAVEVGGGSSVLVGPDNGLLAPVVATVGGADRAVELSNADYHLPAQGATFAARDIFAPAAAQIMKGTDLVQLGTEIDPGALTPHLIPVSRFADGANGAATADILWTDRFGNLQVNLGPKDIDALQTQGGNKIQIRFGDVVRTLKFVKTYAELNQGELGLSIDSYGLAAIVAPQTSAAAELGLKEGDQVELKAIKEL